MTVGLEHISETVVDETNIAATVGSGDLVVLATPAMIALMENAAMLSVAAELPDGSTTVGTLMNVTHTRATGIGRKVSAKATLREVDGRKLIFHISASDDKGVIGEGMHERFVVDIDRFMSRVNREGE